MIRRAPGWFDEPRGRSRVRALIVAVLALVTVGVALAPRPLSSPIARVARYHAKSGDPIYDTVVDGAALRRASAILPGNATYAIWDPTAAPQLSQNLSGATHLFFTPALPVADPMQAGWIFSYQAPTLLPRGLRAARIVRLGPEIALVEVRR